ncbi:hypothetical protein PILCRDRAFT_816090 [Piloderma croceum F 1598]|uniref:L-tryptophan decarboxylase PsiD-like domain-containing protein n=1 Tax=Piloderma croceum (strain F 1598) TaxID=765440 RepID=A0A0C3CAV5_PILCF|nr:hypothetical protein PILCRDRAFT_816090 [Piloderma croceum F 1598]
MFADWATFLSSPDSRKTLGEEEGGWFSQPAMRSMEQYYDEYFDQIFVCEPQAPHKGFTSWDHFFNRIFRKGICPPPLQGAGKLNTACESTLYEI